MTLLLGLAYLGAVVFGLVAVVYTLIVFGFIFRAVWLAVRDLWRRSFTLFC